jgi:isopenicillin N synthase-like dioxygenase
MWLLFDFFTIPLREVDRHELEPGPIPVCPSFNQSDHQDFGAIALLMEDGVGGLQIWDTKSNKWADVKPVPGTPAHLHNSGGTLQFYV